MKILALVHGACLLPVLLCAGQRTGGSYQVTADVVDAGGARSTSSSYSHTGSLGGISGSSSVAAPAVAVLAGYPAQLTEAVSLQLSAPVLTVNEAATRQLGAALTLDDGTTTALLGHEVGWSVLSGPLTSISSGGLATAANVHQNTAATVQGSHSGLSASLGLTVLNVGNDDLGPYASDGIPDSWQVQYFGFSNPLAAPAADASGTGQSNLFKYTAGLDPTSPASRFITTVGRSGAQPTVTLSPRLADRTYTVEFTNALGAGWQPLTGAAVQDAGQVRVITDPDTTSLRKFYRVQITHP